MGLNQTMLVKGASEFKMNVKHYIEMYAYMLLIESIRQRLHKFCEILETTVLNLAFGRKFCIVFSVSPKFVPKSPINNKSSFVLLMTWPQEIITMTSQWVG